MNTPTSQFEPAILTLRDRRVIVDADLARIYGVPTKRFNEAIKRNRRRFPPDFAFRLTPKETADLRSQSATSRAEVAYLKGVPSIVPSAPPEDLHGGRRYLPWAFTEHGALMAANVLRSAQAIRMSVHVVRAFVRQREQLAADAAILKRLAEIDRSLLEHDQTLRILWTRLAPLLAPPPDPPRRRIGFHEKG